MNADEFFPDSGTFKLGQVPHPHRSSAKVPDFDAPISPGYDSNPDFWSPTHSPTNPICSRVLLTISAKKLLDLDPDEIIDPYCVISICDAASTSPIREWIEIGRTEIITNTQEPEWSTKICLTYYFEEQQRLQFEIFDRNTEGFGFPKRIGSCSMLLHEIVGSHMNRLTKTLHEEGKESGFITVTAEELSEGRQESIYFVVSGHNLDRKDFLGKCDPFLKISRINYDDTLQLAYRSRYHEQNLNPKWKPFEILTQQLCYGDKDRLFLIECYDWDQDGDHDFIGSCQTTVNHLLSGEVKELPLINEKKAKKSKKYMDSGQIFFHRVFSWMDFTFLDFIRGGTELDFMVAVDFTKSNLPMDDFSSLHRIDSHRPNQYEIAIGAVAEICQHYNRSKVFYAYGFGAKIPSLDDKVHYNFPLNLERNDARCVGIEGLLNAYLIAQSHVELSGPTDFGPTIRLAAKRAAGMPEDGSKYCVLLILTDGAITDLEATKEEIIKASTLPLSIIVIGVGYDSFEEMKELDSDDRMLRSRKKFAKRDIVQFVQMRKFLPPHRALSVEEAHLAKIKLAKEVLFEVPSQLVGYMKSRGIYPRPPEDPFSYVDTLEMTPISPWITSSGHFFAQSDNDDPFNRKNSFSSSRKNSLSSSRKNSLSSRKNSSAYRSSTPKSPRRQLPLSPDEQFSKMHI